MKIITTSPHRKLPIDHSEDKDIAMVVLRRVLKRGQLIHHINLNPYDNRRENLMVFHDRENYERFLVSGNVNIDNDYVCYSPELTIEKICDKCKRIYYECKNDGVVCETKEKLLNFCSESCKERYEKVQIRQQRTQDVMQQPELWRYRLMTLGKKRLAKMLELDLFHCYHFCCSLGIIGFETVNGVRRACAKKRVIDSVHVTKIHPKRNQYTEYPSITQCAIDLYFQIGKTRDIEDIEEDICDVLVGRKGGTCGFWFISDNYLEMQVAGHKRKSEECFANVIDDDECETAIDLFEL